jgi:hypothetical protein
MILIIALGLFTTLVGVALGCTVLELAVRAVGRSLTERPVKVLLKTRPGLRWFTVMTWR